MDLCLYLCINKKREHTYKQGQIHVPEDKKMFLSASQENLRCFIVKVFILKIWHSTARKNYYLQSESCYVMHKG